MSVNGWMDKNDAGHMYLYIDKYFSHEKEESPGIYDNMGGPWGHYAKWHQ